MFTIFLAEMSDEANFKILAESQLALEQDREELSRPADALIVFIHCSLVSRGLRTATVRSCYFYLYIMYFKFEYFKLNILSFLNWFKISVEICSTPIVVSY